MTDYLKLCDAMEHSQADLWARCYPRCYVNAGAWPSPKVAPTVFASAAHNARVKQAVPMMHPREQNLYALSCMLGAVDFPTYFVARPLLEAVMRTRLPEDLDWREMKMPLPAMTFVLPRGALQREDEGDVAFISIGRALSGERHQFPVPGCPAVRVRDPMLVIATGCPQHPRFPIYDIGVNGNTSPTLAHVSGITNGDEMILASDGEPVFQPMTMARAKFNTDLAILALNLVLVMGARPQLVEEGTLEKVVSRRGHENAPKTRNEFWSPNILGRTYRVKTEGLGGTHASPRVHWRIGHTRWQRHGPGLIHEKELWIEPVFVMGKETTST